MRGRPGSVRSLEELGRVRLSASFFMRDFPHSEIADFCLIPNIKQLTSSIGRTADTMCAKHSGPPGMILERSKRVCMQPSIRCGQRLTKWV